MRSKSTISVNLGSPLTLLFIGLKLTGYIDWSWWWVLAPFWILLVVLGITVLIIGLIIILENV